MKKTLALLLALCLSTSASAQSIYGGATTLFSSVTTQYFVTSPNSTYTPNAYLLYAVAECIEQGGGGGGSTSNATGVSSGGGGGAGSEVRVLLIAAQLGVVETPTNIAAAECR